MFRFLSLPTSQVLEKARQNSGNRLTKDMPHVCEQLSKTPKLTGQRRPEHRHKPLEVGLKVSVVLVILPPDLEVRLWHRKRGARNHLIGRIEIEDWLWALGDSRVEC